MENRAYLPGSLIELLFFIMRIYESFCNSILPYSSFNSIASTYYGMTQMLLRFAVTGLPELSVICIGVLQFIPSVETA